MAGYPPPYTPQPGSPFGLDPRQQARLLRDQARAQAEARKAAFRAQRDFERRQILSQRRSSILGPLLLLTIGIVALLVSFGKLPLLQLSTWYARWWPVVIVAAGVILMLEWGFDQWSAREGSVSFRRSLGGGAVILLLVLIFLGLTARSIHGNSDFLVNGLSINPDNVDEMFGEKYDREQQVDQAFPAGTSLAISNPHGDVTVSGTSPDDKIHITINKEVYSSSEDLANSKAARLTPQVDLSGNVMNLSMPGIDGAVSNLSITVPPSAQSTVTADHGQIRMSGLHSNVNLTSNRGDVQVDNITGSISARCNSSHASFAAHGIAGDLTLRGHADDVNLSDISGQTTIEGEFYGDTHLEKLMNPVTFHTSRTWFTVAKLAGQVDISPDSQLSGDNLAGPTELRTRSRNISFQRLTGNVEITNTNGTVDLTDILPTGSISVQNKNGEVNLSIPEHTGFAMDAETRDGKIEGELPATPVVTGDRSELHGSTGDGSSKISLETTHGNITLHRLQATQPDPQSQLPPPSAGARKVR